MHTWLIAFAVIWTIQFLLFGMQRAALLISRNAGFSWQGGGELLLPRWYPITWAVIFGKWGLLVATAIFFDWKFALGLAVGGFFLSIIVPIPYSAYKAAFRRRSRELARQDPVVGLQIISMLDDAPFKTTRGERRKQFEASIRSIEDLDVEGQRVIGKAIEVACSDFAQDFGQSGVEVFRKLPTEEQMAYILKLMHIEQAMIEGGVTPLGAAGAVGFSLFRGWLVSILEGDRKLAKQIATHMKMLGQLAADWGETEEDDGLVDPPQTVI